MARSPAYPAIGLTEAVEFVRRLFDSEQRTPVTEEVAVQAMGYSGLNGKTRTLISAIKKYGLVTETPGGEVRVSDLALQILHPADDVERLEGLRQAALQVELFRDLVQTHLDASDAALRSYLIRRSFTEGGAQQAIASFRDTVQVANLRESRYTPDEGKDKADLSALVDEKPKTQEEVARRREADQRRRDLESSPTYVWPLPNGREVEIRVTDGGLSKGDLSFLRRYLEVVEDTLAADQPLPALTSSPTDDNEDDVDEGAL